MTKDLLRDLIQAEAEGFEAPASSKKATWDQLEKSIAASAPPPIDLPPAATPSVMVTSGSKFLLWLVVGVLGGLGVAGVAAFGEPDVSRVAAPPPPPPPPVVTTVPEPPPPVAPLPPVEPPVPSPVKKLKKRLRPPPSPPPPPKMDLAAELAILRRAQRAIANEDFETARAAVSQHEKEFPRGAIVEEREALRVVVLCGLGEKDTARARARAFVARFPDSVQVPRVRDACP